MQNNIFLFLKTYDFNPELRMSFTIKYVKPVNSPILT